MTTCDKADNDQAYTHSPDDQIIRAFLPTVCALSLR